MSEAFDILIKLGIVLAVLGGIWWMLQPKWTIRLVVDQGGLRSQRGVASRRLAEIEEFIDNHVEVNHRLTVFAHRDPGGYWKVWFRGKSDAGLQQRIRNFFASSL